MQDFINAFTGGVLLGIAASGYLLVHGRIAGISGLIDQVLSPKPRSSAALWFVAGLVLTPLLYRFIAQPDIQITASPLALIIAGVLVGFGTRLGSGCTSGHGICGISRLSLRSLVATIMFMLSGMVSVYMMRHWLGVMA